ncbi:hypothetical protein BJ912DRAFT_622367 [Pholiota molesta]|nr:hypothetical protein BJ912DRAFT_622367 [Pholiota molesta]
MVPNTMCAYCTGAYIDLWEEDACEPTGKKASHIPSSFRLRTLRPERLSVVGQEVVDLSGKLSPVVPFINGRKLKYMYETTPRLSFPINTRGFFYYYTPTDGPELYAGVRFRICDSPEAFEHGRDLLDPRGDVWGPKILELIKNREKEGFLALLRAENLIDEALIHDINKLDLTQNVRRSQYSLFAPFYLNLALAKRQLTYVTRAKVIVLHFPGQVTTNYSTKCTIRAQFELSDLPEHKELGPTLVIRVLDVVTPITVDPRYHGDVGPVPVPGTLLRRLSLRKRVVVCIPLMRQPMADALFELEDLKAAMQARATIT